MKSERRRNERFRIKDGAYAALRPGFRRLGKIEDMSLNGLSFIYINLSSPDFEHEMPTAIDIFLSDGSLHLHEVPCRLAYDRRDPEYKETRSQSPEQRRCGVTFREEWADEYRADLQMFIQSNSVKEP